jgi:hypothetical protein
MASRGGSRRLTLRNGQRAVALTDLGRYEDAHHDLLRYFALQPEAHNLPEVQARLTALASAITSQGVHGLSGCAEAAGNLEEIV